MLSDKTGSSARSGGRRNGAGKFPDSRQSQARVNAKGAEDFLVACENITKTGELARGRFRESQAACAATGAFTKRARFENNNGTIGSKLAQPGRSGKTREAATNNRNVHVIRNRARCGMKIDGPWRLAPRMNDASHDLFSCFANRRIPMGFTGHGILLMQLGPRMCRVPRLHQALPIPTVN